MDTAEVKIGLLKAPCWYFTKYSGILQDKLLFLYKFIHKKEAFKLFFTALKRKTHKSVDFPTLK